MNLSVQRIKRTAQAIVSFWGLQTNLDRGGQNRVATVISERAADATQPTIEGIV